MMSSAYAVSNNHSSKKSLSLVGILVLSSLGAIMLSPNASASVNGDYEITESISPISSGHYSSWDPVTIEVKVTNTGFYFNSQPREIEWFVCEGVQNEIDCYNQREELGNGIIESLQIGDETVHTMSDKYFPNGDEGLFTMVYRVV